MRPSRLRSGPTAVPFPFSAWHDAQPRELSVKSASPSGVSRQIFPHASEALLFDWTPDGRHLICVLGSGQHTATDGIWIGEQDTADWWHVPHSGELRDEEQPPPSFVCGASSAQARLGAAGFVDLATRRLWRISRSSAGARP